MQPQRRPRWLRRSVRYPTGPPAEGTPAPGPFTGDWRGYGRAAPLERRTPARRAGFASTATGIRTPVSAVRGRRPSPLDDGGRNPASLAAAKHRADTLDP